MYQVDIYSKEIKKIDPVSFSDENLKERQDLQEWIVNNPECLGEKLLIIQKEFKNFDNTNERLDLLALDEQGNLVIIENKTDSSGRDVTWQAIKYASYCSRLTQDNILDLYKDYLERYIKNESEFDATSLAIAKLQEFFGGEDWQDKITDSEQRIILVAADFRPEVTSAVLWLREFDIDIKCVKCGLYKLSDTTQERSEIYLFDTQQIIPVINTEGMVIGVSKKKEEERRYKNKRAKALFELWSYVINFQLNGYENLLKDYAPSKANWMSAPLGWDAKLVCVANYGRLKVSIDINRGGVKEDTLRLFEHLKANEHCFQDKELNVEFLRKDNGIYSQITVGDLELDYRQKENLDKIAKFFIETMNQAKQAFNQAVADFSG